MKSLKINFLFVSLFTATLLSIFVISCEKDLPTPVQDEAVQTIEPNIESTIVTLEKDDPILKSLQASQDVQNYNTTAGRLLWEQAAMITYNSAETLPLLLVPIDNGVEGALSMFVAAYNETKGEFHAFINNFDLPSSAFVEEGYTGTIEYKTVENVMAMKADYEKGKLVKEYQPDLSHANYRGVNIDCFLTCIRLAGAASILSGVPVVCASSASCCLAAPAPVNPCCVVFAGCILYQGGVAGACAWNCWE